MGGRRDADGGTPGRSLTTRLVPLIPALMLALVDVRRRWMAASLAAGTALFLIAGFTMVRAPAFAHAVPGATTFGIGVLLTLGATLAGGWLGSGLATRVTMNSASTSLRR